LYALSRLRSYSGVWESLLLVESDPAQGARDAFVLGVLAGGSYEHEADVDAEHMFGQRQTARIERAASGLDGPLRVARTATQNESRERRDDGSWFMV
jgi:hypothetical protein